MEMADISGLEQRYPHEISWPTTAGRPRPRARHRPSLLLLDEPLSHLDQELRDSVRSELLSCSAKPTPRLFVSHDIEDAMVMADRMVVLREGTAEQVGTQLEIYDRPANPHVARCSAKQTSSRLACCRMRPTHSRTRRRWPSRPSPSPPVATRRELQRRFNCLHRKSGVDNKPGRASGSATANGKPNPHDSSPGNTTVKPGETLTVSCDLTYKFSRRDAGQRLSDPILRAYGSLREN